MPKIDLSAQVSGLALGYMNYEQIKENSGQFMTNIFWDVDFVEMAPAVYFPGKDFLRTRCISAQVNLDDGEMETIRTEIRGFQIIAPAGSKAHGGTLTLQLQDFDDQSITTWLWDWYCKVRDPKTNYMFHTNDVKAPLLILTQYNNQRIPLKRWVCRGLAPNNVGEWTNFQGASGDPEDTGKVSVTFTVENMKLELLTNVE